MDTSEMIFNESLTTMSNEDDEEAAIHEHLEGIDDDQTQQINQLDTRDRISDSFVIFSTTQHLLFPVLQPKFEGHTYTCILWLKNEIFNNSCICQF